MNGSSTPFPDWPEHLQADQTLSPGLRESYRRTLQGFHRFCWQRREEVSLNLARHYVELTRLESAPSSALLQEWKDALNWFFRRRKEAATLAFRSVPPLARDDLGRGEWEPRLIGRLRLKGFSWRTEQTYRGWTWRMAQFLGARPLASASGADVRAFLTRLVVEERLGVASQKQALNALLFYFRQVEGKDLGDVSGFAQARRRVRMPVVLCREECDRLFDCLEGTPRLMAELMFGSGLRLAAAPVRRWHDSQLIGRIKQYVNLPETLQTRCGPKLREIWLRDLRAVAKALLPEADPDSIRAIATYAYIGSMYCPERKNGAEPPAAQLPAATSFLRFSRPFSPRLRRLWAAHSTQPTAQRLSSHLAVRENAASIAPPCGRAVSLGCATRRGGSFASAPAKLSRVAWEFAAASARVDCA